MNVVVDVGNTDMKFGFFKEESYLGGFRIATKRDTTSDELALRYVNLSELNKIPSNGKVDVLISSVVPSVNRVLEKMFLRRFQARVFFLEASMISDIEWNRDARQMGKDRLVNVKSAKDKYPQPLAVASLGTATTIDFLDKNAYQGGLILPGVLTSLSSLIESAEQLSPIRLEPPTKLLSMNTDENINNGVYYLHREGIIGIVEKIYDQYVKKGDLSVVFTGGISNFMQFESEALSRRHIKVYNDPSLTVRGLSDVLKRLLA